MAKTRESLKSDIRTSIHGRRLGLTHDDYLVGPKQALSPVTNATSASTATNLLPYGLHTLIATTVPGNDTVDWTLDDPTVAGLKVTLVTASESTADHNVVFNNSTVVTLNGTASSSLTMQGVGAVVELTSISTASWVGHAVLGTTLVAGATAVFSS